MTVKEARRELVNCYNAFREAAARASAIALDFGPGCNAIDVGRELEELEKIGHDCGELAAKLARRLNPANSPATISEPTPSGV